ncbi:MAG: ferritin-like domain-containing protein [Flavobacteriales bacterium]|nr:ferritin-like domain-containing protein [Flavobacteriales bacterium]
MATKKEPTTGLRKLLEDQLADIYFAEKQLVKALPTMVKAANHPELRAAFEEHLEETKVQVERIERVFEALDLPAKPKTCPAILGILQECNELMEEFADDDALDAALVDGGRKVEHYEIATYSSLCAWAEQLGLYDAAGLLKENLEEEQAADEKLSGIGEEVIAATGPDDEEGELVEADDDDRALAGQRAGKRTPAAVSKRATNGSARKTSSSGRKR